MIGLVTSLFLLALLYNEYRKTKVNTYQEEVGKFLKNQILENAILWTGSPGEFSPTWPKASEGLPKHLWKYYPDIRLHLQNSKWGMLPHRRFTGLAHDILVVRRGVDGLKWYEQMKIGGATVYLPMSTTDRLRCIWNMRTSLDDDFVRCAKYILRSKEEIVKAAGNHGIAVRKFISCGKLSVHNTTEDQHLSLLEVRILADKWRSSNKAFYKYVGNWEDQVLLQTNATLVDLIRTLTK